MADVGIIWADDADLIAISDYVQNQRPKISKFPKLQPKIEDFERWLQGLGWVDIHVMINDTIAEAARRRDEINAIEGQAIDPTWIPADKIGMKPGSTGLSGQKPPLVPTWVLPAAVVSSAVAFTLLVAKKIVFPFF